MAHELRCSAERLASQLVAWRRHLHAHPELSGREEQTAHYIAEQLRGLGLEPQERIGGTCGLMATIGTSGPAVALRADMDALPVAEENDVEYRSQSPGVMHACGHDAHVAMLLGAARLLVDRRAALRRSVKLIFQPHEEVAPGGAQPLIDAGVLADVACVFGLHVWADMPTGALGTRAGPFMSNVDDLALTIHGRGGHAAMPHQAVDPVLMAGQIICALHTIVSRSVAMTEPAVLSITQVRGGTALNVIPEAVELRGTIRTLMDATRTAVHRRVHEVARGVAAAHGGNAEVAITPCYPALVNDPRAVEHAFAAARALGVPSEQLLTLPAQGGGEDFAYYARERPAALLFLGARNEAKGCAHPHHHPRFDLDEDALPLGAALFAQVALTWPGD